MTSAECLAIAERKIGQAIGDRRYGKELEATARAWLVLADRIEQGEALEAMKAKAKDLRFLINSKHGDSA